MGVHTDILEIAKGVRQVSAQVEVLAGRLVAVAEQLADGGRAYGYRHTGIDLNLDRAPWGDVERGAPVFAMSAGQVLAAESSAGWLGVVVVRHVCGAGDVYVRYAHLDPERLLVGTEDGVRQGEILGYLGNWRGGDGGDHLHLDMATAPFHWSGWLTSGVPWVDPVPVLERMVGAGVVARMLGRGDG